MSNKQRKIAKKKEREKKNKKARNINNNKKQLKMPENHFMIPEEMKKEDNLSFLIASRDKILDASGVESIQATALFMWDKLKEATPTQSRANLLDYIQNQEKNIKKTLKENYSTAQREQYYENTYKCVEELMSLDLFLDKEYEKAYKENCAKAIEYKWDCVEFTGNVVGVKYGFKDNTTGVFNKNVVNAILLASVKVWDCSSSEWVLIADHMWVYTNRLLFSVIDGFTDLSKKDLSIHIGDLVCGKGNVIQYQSIGEARFGIDWWYPTDVLLRYVYTGKNIPEIIRVPDKIPRKACLCQLKPDSEHIIYDGRTKAGIKSKIEEDIIYLRNYYSKCLSI